MLKFNFRNFLLIIWSITLTVTLTACGGGIPYTFESQAPAMVKQGKASPGLILSNFAGPLSQDLYIKTKGGDFDGPIADNRQARDFLLSQAKPLDILLTRSKEGLLSALNPSRFTHASLWLGNTKDLVAAGFVNVPEFNANLSNFNSGPEILEAAFRDVHLSPYDSVLEQAELAIFRPVFSSQAEKIKVFRTLMADLGTGFDINFDLLDTSKLTCIELVEKAYPQVVLPRRYSAGRLVTVPDDLARLVLNKNLDIQFIRHFATDPNGKTIVLPPSTTYSNLSSPR